ncbi:NADH dehydrogenase (quinone) [Leptospirillum ferriphilum]|uniref:NADH dehydrogenase (Quinone) n=3 Tax=Leptospirillum TaxID=179 RepID=A0A094W592_9BACT|nr:hydrogenase 4 subunit F [Leptospirillum ferriphilum]AFS53937.1 NADH dehydrogenase (Quinone) [Leptospirillum ferriphilum ML-04]EDZ38280.1 MAG: NADH dehydrogenase (Quinone) [Leptospirillum sp. Group II '5-way CG']KGA92578.1 NADH dehydrogenase (quinone) [Leptospirillum ferriphilum]
MDLFVALSIPLLSAAVFSFTGDRPWAPAANGFSSFALFLATLVLAAHGVLNPGVRALSGQLFLDPLNLIFLVLTALVSLTTALYSVGYVRFETASGRLGPTALRLYHSLFQMVVFSMVLGLLSNNLGLLWVALETATLSNAFLVSLYKTPRSIEAAWKYFVLLGVGIAQAFFGLILLYFAAERELGPGGKALLWTELAHVQSRLDPTVLSLAFIFFFVGFGTKAGLVPLHGWLPDAHAEGPTPASAILSGLLLNLALYALLRVKVLADAVVPNHLTGHILLAFGFLSVLVAVFSLWKRNDVKRLFSYSSIEHLGIASVGFGLGGPAATLAALLHMTFHSLTKSCVFFLAGTAAQCCRSQKIQDIRGLLALSPFWGWAFVLAGLALLGMPPFGLFASEFLLLRELVRTHPLLAGLFLLSLSVAFAVLLKRILAMVSGDRPAGGTFPVFAKTPVLIHLSLLAILGIGIPSVLWQWYRKTAQYLTGLP